MNIPPEVARAQAHHGIKGAPHGSKGGRPKLDLTDDERKERRRKQHEDHRRRKGIMPREILTWEERRELDRIARAKRRDEEYRSVWGKLPGERLSAAEFEKRYRAFQSWVRACQARNYPLAWSVDFVRRHYREERRRQRAEEMKYWSDVEPNLQAQFDEWARRRSVAPSVTPPSVGRNEPCPCGSGRKFKKCCGR